jgi:hypothetical protein
LALAGPADLSTLADIWDRISENDPDKAPRSDRSALRRSLCSPW